MSSSTPAQSRSAPRRVLTHWLSGRGAEALTGWLMVLPALIGFLLISTARSVGRA